MNWLVDPYISSTNLLCYGINKKCCLKICSECWPSTNGTCVSPLSSLWKWSSHNIQAESKTNYLKYLSFTITLHLFVVIKYRNSHFFAVLTSVETNKKISLHQFKAFLQIKSVVCTKYKNQEFRISMNLSGNKNMQDLSSKYAKNLHSELLWLNKIFISNS